MSIGSNNSNKTLWPGVAKFVEIESNLVVVMIRGEVEMKSSCLKSPEFRFGRMTRPLEADDGYGSTIMWRYLMPLNSILKNGWEG